jgi:hypothetical protein
MTKKEKAQLKAEFKEHAFDPHVAEHGADSTLPLDEAFEEFLRTLQQAGPNARPSWRDA